MLLTKKNYQVDLYYVLNAECISLLGCMLPTVYCNIIDNVRRMTGIADMIVHFLDIIRECDLVEQVFCMTFTASVSLLWSYHNAE